MNSSSRTFRMLVATFTCARMVSMVSFAPIALAAPDAGAATVQESSLSIQKFVDLTNVSREAVGLPDLRLSAQLDAAAEAHAQDMIARHYWGHYGPNGNETPWHFISATGYTYTVAGENLARGFNSPEEITTAWLRSPEHAANLLSNRYTEVGFATATTYDDQGRQIILTVQMFGSR